MRKVEIKIDFLAEGVDSAILVNWYKNNGDKVEKGELICEVETYKAVFQLEAPESGVLSELKFSAGDQIPVPCVLGYIQAA